MRTVRTPVTGPGSTGPGSTATRERLLHDVTTRHDAARVALRFHGDGSGPVELTYGDLEERSNRLAHALVRAGAGPGGVVGLLLDGGPELPVAQLAVLKAGAAWLPLDPQHPVARLALQVEDAGPPLVLATARLAGQLPERGLGAVPVWVLDDPVHRAALACLPDVAPPVDVRPDDGAYVIYTSGSTGRPKGVLVTHRAAAAFCATAAALLRLTPLDRLAQVSNPAFDTHLIDSFTCLHAGGTMIGAPRSTFTDPAALTALLRTERVTVTYAPPAILAVLDPAPLHGGPLRAVVSAGSALGADQAQRWSRPGIELYNAYGPTETTVLCTAHLCVPGPQPGPPPIGTPLPGYRTYVLDARLRPSPIGIPGQLYIAGAGVAAGYRGRAGRTAERFLADPYGGPGDRMYASGDLVHWRPDGALQFLGRIDRQVKLRGQRIELGEIEHVLGLLPGVRQATVVHRAATEQLAAYYVGPALPDAVRAGLADHLPAFMVPAALVALPALPLTPNGKLDPARLPEPDMPVAAHRAPGTATERWLAACWQELLGVEEVGADDTFFSRGANSLHTTQLVGRVRARFGVALQPGRLFADPTVAQLAAFVDAQEPHPVDVPGSRIEPVARGGRLAATPQQVGLWFLAQQDPGSPVYHLPTGLRLRGDLDVAALAAAVHALVVRHEALRTRFVEVGGEPCQVVDPAPAEHPLPRTDVAPADVPAWVATQVERPFDLAAGPLLRTALARTAPDEHVLVMVVHHIVADGWSLRLLAAELSRLYTERVGGPPAALPELPVQPADHAAWLRGPAAADLERGLDHWRTVLADLPTLDLPADRSRPARPTGAGAELVRAVPDDLSDAAQAHAREQRVSFLAVAQAALATVLHRYTGHTDIAIGTVFSGRTRAELEPLVGYFVNAAVLRTDVGGDPTFGELVRRCHDTVVAATEHQDVPFGEVVEVLGGERVTGRNPLFQVALTVAPARGGGGDGALGLPGLTAEVIGIGTGTARFDLGIELEQSADGRLGLAVEYSTELFDADRVDRLVDHFLTVLAAGLAAPGTPVGALDLLPPAELGLVLDGWNPPPAQPLPGLLHEVVAGHPAHAVAVRHGGVELTYGELRRRAGRLAHVLRGRGVGRGAVVATLFDRGLHLPVALLGVLGAGAAWTPLDPAHPRARTAVQVADAAAALVLTTRDLAGLAPDGVPLLVLDDPTALAGQSGAPPRAAVRPDDAAYVIYTSGSTGTPKGVQIGHASAVQHCRNAVGMYGMTADDRMAQVANPAFDVTVTEVFATLLAGATLVVADRPTVVDPAALTALLRDERITCAYLPPPVLALLQPDDLDGAALRALDLGGEGLTAELVNRWTRPGRTLHNAYGPTETTVVATDHAFPGGPLSGLPPIGTALPHHRVYVLDERLRPAPIGVPGHLHVAGSGVAHGYLRRPGATATRFVPDPYGEPGRRMYATGDLARWRADGELEFLGRLDRQVKVRGQRVEIGEVEHVLAGCPGVRQAAVVQRAGALVAYLVGAADPAAVRVALADRLPGFMVPAAFVSLPVLPLTPNGKLDPARLPEPVLVAEHVEPATATERWLVEVWRELLGADRVGVRDDFFALGGSSLTALRLAARVREQLDRDLPTRLLFTDPVLADLAARLDEQVPAPVAAPAGTDDGTAVLDDEIEELERRLAAHEERVAQLRRRRAGRDRP